MALPPIDHFRQLRAGINKLLGVVEPDSLVQQENSHEAEYLAAGPAEGSATPHVSPPAESHAGPHEASYVTSHVSSHAGSPASVSARSPHLTTARIGDRSRVVNGKAEWSNEDFAGLFLRWFTEACPEAWGTWVWFPDIKKHFFPRFRAATGARYLQLGALIRGLRTVTQTRPVQYVDGTGRRRSTAEYWIGPTS